MHFKKILVPLDGSAIAEQILPYVRIFAETCRARIEMLLVADPEIRPPFLLPLPGRRYLNEATARYLPASSAVQCVEERGKPAEVIVDRAKAEPGCLIAMATHGRSGIKRWLLGSVTEKVVYQSSKPVLIVRATTQ